MRAAVLSKPGEDMAEEQSEEEDEGKEYNSPLTDKRASEKLPPALEKRRYSGESDPQEHIGEISELCAHYKLTERAKAKALAMSLESRAHVWFDQILHQILDGSVNNYKELAEILMNKFCNHKRRSRGKEAVPIKVGWNNTRKEEKEKPEVMDKEADHPEDKSKLVETSPEENPESRKRKRRTDCVEEGIGCDEIIGTEEAPLDDRTRFVRIVEEMRARD